MPRQPIDPDKKAVLGLGLCNTSDLLTPEQQADLDRDLREMAAQRRRAEAESRNIYLA